jgi:hypothetical protein
MKRSDALVMACVNVLVALVGIGLLRTSSFDTAGMVLMLVVAPFVAVVTIGFAIRDLLKRNRVSQGIIAICASIGILGLRLMIRI